MWSDVSERGALVVFFFLLCGVASVFLKWIGFNVLKKMKVGIKKDKLAKNVAKRSEVIHQESPGCSSTGKYQISNVSSAS